VSSAMLLVGDRRLVALACASKQSQEYLGVSVLIKSLRHNVSWLFANQTYCLLMWLVAMAGAELRRAGPTNDL
jgi:hypothetical protein